MTTQNSRISKRRVGAVIAAAATFAIVSASAATLGGLGTESVGAESGAVVAPVTTGVTLNFATEYFNGGYVVSDVTLTANSDIPSGASIKVTLADTEQTSLKELSGTGEGDSDVTWADVNISAEDLANVAVVINGEVVSNVTLEN